MLQCVAPIGMALLAITSKLAWLMNLQRAEAACTMKHVGAVSMMGCIALRLAWIGLISF